MRVAAELQLKALVKQYGLSDVVGFLEELCQEQAKKLDGDGHHAPQWCQAAQALHDANIPIVL